MTEPTATPPVTNPPATAVTAPTGNDPAPTGADRTFTQADVDRIVQDRLAREKVRRDEEAEKARREAEAQAAAKNQEWEKLAKQRETELATAQQELAKRDLADLKRKIAKEAGLSEDLAGRLNGTTEDELKADAQALLTILPKPTEPKPKPASPGILPTNPGAAGGAVHETDVQKLARLRGNTIDPFGEESARQFGGGVYFTPKE